MREVSIDSIRPSQLYISEDKYAYWCERIRAAGGEDYDPIPIKRVGRNLFFTDGHTRALVLWELGAETIRVVDDTDPLDWMAYLEDLDWCRSEGVLSIRDLSRRMVDGDGFKRLWRNRCEAAREKLTANPFHGVAISVEDDPEERAIVCAEVLRALPEWFGIESAIEEYVNDVRELDTLVVRAFGTPIGFVAISYHFALHADLHVLGLLPEFHGRGLGRKMIERAADRCRERTVRYLTVKTLAESHPDPNYARTRRFYERCGFLPFEVFPSLWGEANPCLQMFMTL
jgi:GNAT superfamily N-acetyltransferase